MKRASVWSSCVAVLSLLGVQRGAVVVMTDLKRQGVLVLEATQQGLNQAAVTSAIIYDADVDRAFGCHIRLSLPSPLSTQFSGRKRHCMEVRVD